MGRGGEGKCPPPPCRSRKPQIWLSVFSGAYIYYKLNLFLMVTLISSTSYTGNPKTLSAVKIKCCYLPVFFESFRRDLNEVKVFAFLSIVLSAALKL